MESMRRTIFRIRHYRCKHFFLALSLLGLIVLASGVVLLVCYTDAPTYTPNPNLQGFAVLKNNNVTAEQFGVTIYADINPPQLFFRYFFNIASAGYNDINFTFIFPFYVQKSIANYTDYDMIITHNATYSLILVHLRIESGPQGYSDSLQGLFSISQTYMSGNRGSYVLSLPFGTGLDFNTSSSLNQEYGTNLYLQNVTIAVVLPKNDVPTSYFPTPSPNPLYGAYYNGKPPSSLEWGSSVPVNDLVSQSDETVILQNQNEISFYSYVLFLSGILLGTGISLLFTVVYDELKERHERPEDFE